MSRHVFSTGDTLLCQQKLQLDGDHVILSYLLCRQTTKKTNFTCSAREQTRKWRLRLSLVRLQTWSLTALGEGMKILCIKDHIRSCINDFRERIRITNPSFAVGR